MIYLCMEAKQQTKYYAFCTNEEKKNKITKKQPEMNEKNVYIQITDNVKSIFEIEPFTAMMEQKQPMNEMEAK